MSRKLNLHINALAEIALKSDMANQHAAGLVVGGKMVAVGWNQGCRSKVGTYYGPSLHAEPAALLNLAKQRQCFEKWVL